MLVRQCAQYQQPGTAFIIINCTSFFFLKWLQSKCLLWKMSSSFLNAFVSVSLTPLLRFGCGTKLNSRTFSILSSASWVLLPKARDGLQTTINHQRQISSGCSTSFPHAVWSHAPSVLPAASGGKPSVPLRWSQLVLCDSRQLSVTLSHARADKSAEKQPVILGVIQQWCKVISF